MTFDPEKLRAAQERAAADGREFRYLPRPVELRSAGDTGELLVGHASVFDTDTPIGPPDNPWWIERVDRGAFRQTIVDDDIRALFNHNENVVLGRNRAGTLRLSEDSVGLACEISPPDTSDGRDMVVLVRRGDVSQMSIGMQVLKQVWEELPGGTIRRTVQIAKLWDVSPVTYPAFPTTDIAVKEARSAGLIARSADVDGYSTKRARNRLALAEMIP